MSSFKPILQPATPDDDARTQRLERYLEGCSAARRVHVERRQRLSGGAIQENWLLEVRIDGGPCAGQQRWVLRTDAPSAVQASLSRAQEFAVLRTVFDAGVKVPQPLWFCDEPEVHGRPFFLMRMLDGIAAGHRLTQAAGTEGDARLAAELGANLARLHAIHPPLAALDFLPPPRPNPALASVEEYRGFLDRLPERHPVLEWGLRWCELNAPTTGTTCLLHRDYRTGNYLVHDGALSGVLDWEFTGWGDPREDLGWFTAPCWRFARPDLAAGGIGRLEDFLAGYAEISGRQVDGRELRYWQVMATLRWAVIALQQAERHLSGEQPSLELALTGRMLPELELDILDLTREDAR